jgi:hypothetical protein
MSETANTMSTPTAAPASAAMPTTTAELLAIVKRNQLMSIAVGSAGLLFLAGLGPQVGSTHSLNVMSYNLVTATTHSLVPGWVYLLVSLVAGGGLRQYVRTGTPEWLMVTRLAATLGWIGVLLELVQNTVTSTIGLGGAGWGYYLAFLSTFVLAFVTRVMSSRAKRLAKSAKNEQN